MNNSQMHLHSENFDLCRICLLEPETNRHVKFLHIFAPNSEGVILCQQISELLGVTVEKNDIKPKMICEHCHKALGNWAEMKKKAAESQIVINYIAKKKFAANSSRNSQLVSNESDTSFDSRNNVEPAQSNASHSLTRSQRISNKPVTKSNLQINCSSSSNQDTCSQFNSIQSTRGMSVSSESDGSISCEEVNVNNEIISISSDEEDTVRKNLKSEYINYNTTDELSYCSICKKKSPNNHDCSQYNKQFSTCLVPNCNILSRTLKDITPHYRKHIGMPTGVMICRHCYQENKTTERDVNGFHTCSIINVFKCYTCNIIFKTMSEFAYHKLKLHNGRLINSSGLYLCFHCEKSSPDLMQIAEHIKHCRENQTKDNQKNVTDYNMKVEVSEENNSEILIGKNDYKRAKDKKIPRSSQHLLFTCLKPSCNLIFQNFAVFKFHHREHFEIGNKLMCWQCCVPFTNLNSLRMHQVKGSCRTPGMFKCFECPEVFNDLQSLSIHKYTIHDGDLIANKKNKKTIICAFCRTEISIHNFKNHLVKCQYKNETKISPKPNMRHNKAKYCYSKCEFCDKVCLTAAALSSHVKTHNSSSTKKKIKKRLSYTSMKSNLCDESANTRHDEVVDEDLNEEEHNGTMTSNHEMDDTIDNKEAYDVIEETCSGTSKSNETLNDIDYDTFPIVDNYYCCIKCSKKFISKKGIKKHWISCSSDRINVKFEKVNHNYYCTLCEDYFTQFSFGEHWKVSHGRRLAYNRYKRFSCVKCSIKFIYKIALSMHNEHVHGDEDISNNTIMLPIISETKSLANHNAEASIGNNFNHNSNIEPKNNIDTSLDECNDDQDEEMETEYVHDMNEQNNDLSDSRNNEEQDLSNNNDDDDDDGDDDIVDNEIHCIKVNEAMDSVNDIENEINKEQLSDDLITVNGVNELEVNNDVTESEENIIEDKKLSKLKLTVVGNNEKNVDSITGEEIQYCIDDIVTISNNLNDCEIINSAKVLTASSDKTQETNKLSYITDINIIEKSSIINTKQTEKCLVINQNKAEQCSVINTNQTEKCLVVNQNKAEQCSVINTHQTEECSEIDTNQTEECSLISE